MTTWKIHSVCGQALLEKKGPARKELEVEKSDQSAAMSEGIQTDMQLAGVQSGDEMVETTAETTHLDCEVTVHVISDVLQETGGHSGDAEERGGYPGDAESGLGEHFKEGGTDDGQQLTWISVWRRYLQHEV